MDGAGNVFVTEQGAGKVYKLPAGGGAPIQIGSGFSNPYAIAVDSAGNVFVTDVVNNNVVEIPASGPQKTLMTGIGLADGVAVDAAGNVFASGGNGGAGVVELPAGSTTPVQIYSGMVHGIAIDGAGNVFIGITGGVVELPRSQGPSLSFGAVDQYSTTSAQSVTVQNIGNATLNAVSPGLTIPVGFASSGTTCNSTFSLAPGASCALNIALAPQTTSVFDGNIVLTDNALNAASATQNIALTGSASVRLTSGSPNCGTVNVGSSQTFTFTYSVTIVSGTNTPKVLTQGVENLDFTLASSPVSCVDNTCTETVQVRFAPRAPGLRMGAILIRDSSGKTQGTTYIQGIGQGPAAAFSPAVQKTLVSGLGRTASLTPAVDAAGNLFFSDDNLGRLLELAPGSTTPTVLATGLNFPSQVAVDGLGNIYVADQNNKRVIKLPPGGGSLSTVGTGLGNPTDVAVDGAGNVFIADQLPAAVYKVPADGGAQTMIGSGFSGPIAVAVDGLGNVFVLDAKNANIVEIPVSGPQQTLLTGLGVFRPASLAVDAAGDLFIADSNSGALELSAGSTTAVQIYNGYAEGIAVDGSGNVFIGERTGQDGGVIELQRSQAPSLSFASTTAGSASSPQSVTLQNIGNQNLTAVSPGLTIPTGFQQVAGSGTPADCTSSFSLAPAATCNLSIRFAPQSAGAFSTSGCPYRQRPERQSLGDAEHPAFRGHAARPDSGISDSRHDERGQHAVRDTDLHHRLRSHDWIGEGGHPGRHRTRLHLRERNHVHRPGVYSKPDLQRAGPVHAASARPAHGRRHHYG